MEKEQKLRKAYLYQRFSSDAQKGNSSAERQLDLQNEWLEKNSHRAVLEDSMLDEGYSATKGNQIKFGRLGKFIDAIDEGLIEQGSFLLVENFTRLTRFDIENSEDLIKKFWKAGITIVTVSNGEEFEPIDVNDASKRTRLMFEFDRAYKEIEWHKKKISYSYERRLKQFKENKAIPKMRRPFWLDKEGNLIKENQKVVERMFQLYVEGNGQVLVDRALKKEFPDNDAVKQMNATTIVRWITSDIVRGIWRDEKIFPAAVGGDLYRDAINAHTERYNKHKSSNAKRLWPLSGLFRCGHCISSRKTNEHSGMTIQQSKGSLPLLRCSHRQRKGSDVAECAKNGEPTTFPYILAHWFFICHVQKSALEKFTKINSDGELKKELVNINIEIAKNTKSKEALKLQLKRLLAKGANIESISDLLSEIEEKILNFSERKSEIIYELERKNKFIVSPEASGLIDNVEKFNSTMRQLDIQIFIKDNTLYYDGKKGFENLGYCKKTKDYYYFDHAFMKIKCPIPMAHDINVLLMTDSDKVHDSIIKDDRMLMHGF
ncbi:recombinase family protein [Salinimonas lutimaris]|uniref:recombinase family protein n=1 Tax=Salinimonas lutimaris TaxID=914153 RepID=UPI0010BFF3DA|nr:recombinase family protein [Salinimonas lutimaris]